MYKKIIFFDIDDTLFESSNFRIWARKKSIKELGKSLGKFGFLFEEKFLFDEFEKVYQLDKNAPDMYDRLLERLEIPGEQISRHVAVAVATWEDNKRKMKGFPGTVDVLKKLLKRGYVLGAASSGVGIKQWDKLYRIGVIDFFDPKYVFITSEVNGQRRRFTKDDLFYRQIVNVYDDKFEEYIMVGDKFSQDIVPAHRAGFKTIFIKSSHFKSSDEIRAREMGIPVVSSIKGIINYL